MGGYNPPTAEPSGWGGVGKVSKNAQSVKCVLKQQDQ